MADFFLETRMKLRHIFLVLVVCLSVAHAASEGPSAEDLAKESIQKCQDTATTKPTPKLIVEKVNAAADLVAKEGTVAFPKFKGKDSQFIFAGTYIWIHNLDGVMLMHPIKPKMESQRLLGLRDPNGKLFFVEINRLVAANGSAWIDYYWPKPGQKDPSLKVSYAKLVKRGDENFVVCCGAYDMSLEDVSSTK